MTQRSYSQLWNGFTDEEAKAARDADYRLLRELGFRANRSVLKGQLRQYWGFGDPCGRSCTVYQLDFDSAGLHALADLPRHPCEH